MATTTNPRRGQKADVERSSKRTETTCTAPAWSEAGYRAFFTPPSWTATAERAAGKGGGSLLSITLAAAREAGATLIQNHEIRADLGGGPGWSDDSIGRGLKALSASGLLALRYRWTARGGWQRIIIPARSGSHGEVLPSPLLQPGSVVVIDGIECHLDDFTPTRKRTHDAAPMRQRHAAPMRRFSNVLGSKKHSGAVAPAISSEAQECPRNATTETANVGVTEEAHAHEEPTTSGERPERWGRGEDAHEEIETTTEAAPVHALADRSPEDEEAPDGMMADPSEVATVTPSTRATRTGKKAKTPKPFHAEAVATVLAVEEIIERQTGRRWTWAKGRGQHSKGAAIRQARFLLANAHDAEREDRIIRESAALAFASGPYRENGHGPLVLLRNLATWRHRAESRIRDREHRERMERESMAHELRERERLAMKAASSEVVTDAELQARKRERMKAKARRSLATMEVSAA